MTPCIKVRIWEASVILHRGFDETCRADPRAIGFLLACLQFAGGWFLLFPFARLVPPFVKLFAVLPPWIWAIYFIISGLCMMIATCLPDEADCGKFSCMSWRFNAAAWSFFNWFFLTTSSIGTVIYLLARQEGAVVYGIAMAFYPVLAMAAYWKLKRLRAMERQNYMEKVDAQAHISLLQNSARHNIKKPGNGCHGKQRIHTA